MINKTMLRRWAFERGMYGPTTDAVLPATPVKRIADGERGASSDARGTLDPKVEGLDRIGVVGARLSYSVGRGVPKFSFLER